MSKFAEQAKAVATAYGPALTKCLVEGDLSTFKDLFITEESVSVILQNAEGNEVHFTVGDQEDATMTWQEFQDNSTQDLASQDFLKTESECLGVLGDRMILETGRINKSGEVYQEVFSLVTLNEEGKITMLESFSDVNAPILMAAAEK